MFPLLLRMGLRPTRRFVLTVVGVAVCTMYIFGSFSLVSGLHRVSSFFSPEDDFEGVFSCDAGSFFTADDVVLNGSYVFGLVLPMEIVGVNGSFFGVGFYDVGVMGFPPPPMGECFVPSSSPLSSLAGGNISVVFPGYASEDFVLGVTGVYSSSLFPENWVVVNLSFVQGLVGGEFFNFAVVNGSVVSVESGLVVSSFPSLSSFFSEGLRDVERDLFLVVFFASLISGLIVYTVVHLEILARAGDVVVLRGVGGSARHLFLVFGSQGLVVGFLGGVFGVALGTLAASFISTAITFFGSFSLLSPSFSLFNTFFAVGVSVLTSFFASATAVYMYSRGGVV